MSSLSATVLHVGLGFGKLELVSLGCYENNFVIGIKILILAIREQFLIDFDDILASLILSLFTESCSAPLKMALRLPI